MPPKRRARCASDSTVLDRAQGRDYIIITEDATKAKLVRIGNSRGVRLPKPLIEEAGLADEVELHARPGAIVIAPSARPRAGWAEAAEQARARDEDLLVAPPTPTRFDEQQWEW